MKSILTILSSTKYFSVHPDVARKRWHKHPTGFFLSELAVPAMALEQAGYQLVYASPTGDPQDSRVDPISVSPQWFPKGEFREAQKYLCPPVSLAIKDACPEDYAAVFIPGGHAPMEDLVACSELGTLLINMACQQKLIAAICHGPGALLSAGNFFGGRRITCFSKAEEQQEEPGQDNVLGGFVPFYLDEQLEERGLEIVTRLPWKPHVVVDEGLVTGQNPMSDHLFAESFLAGLQDTK